MQIDGVIHDVDDDEKQDKLDEDDDGQVVQLRLIVKNLGCFARKRS